MDYDMLKLVLIEADSVSKEAFDAVKQKYNLKDEDFNVFKKGYLTGVTSAYKEIMEEFE